MSGDIAPGNAGYHSKLSGLLAVLELPCIVGMFDRLAPVLPVQCRVSKIEFSLGISKNLAEIL